MAACKQLIDTQEDISVPIIAIPDIDGLTPAMREANDSHNRFLLSERESHGKRTKLRIGVEVWARTRHNVGYVRLRNKHVVLSLPSADQAELAIEMIRQLCTAMAGKHLCKRE
jgi:hypothetical protein